MMKSYNLKQRVRTPYFKDKASLKRVVSILIAFFSVFLFLYMGLPDTFPNAAKLMTAIVGFGVTVWALEPIPMGLTAFIIHYFNLNAPI